MTQPHRPQQGIIPLLIQEQLSRVSESRVHLAVFIDVGCDHPGAGLVVQVEDAAFADVDVEADVLLAPSKRALVNERIREKDGLD
jgi:hypothetical protein